MPTGEHQVYENQMTPCRLRDLLVHGLAPSAHSKERKANMRPYVFAMILVLTAVCTLPSLPNSYAADAKVLIALNYPESGPYEKQGLDEWRAAEMARLEINAAGGILGKQVEFRLYDSKSNPKVSQSNVLDAIDRAGVKMVFGGVSSGVALAVAKICQEKGVPFFGTLTYSTATTGSAGERYTFRECYNAWPAAKAIAHYLNKHYEGKKYFYITADYTWGWTTEASFRKFTDTEDAKKYPHILTPFPSSDFTAALKAARRAKPDVLVLILFGDEMASAVHTASAMGLKEHMQIVVPNLTIGMAERGSPQDMEGVIGAVPWTWKVPFQYNYPRGKEFVEKFAERFNRYPGTAGASAYTIMHEYKAAVERAGSFDGAKVIKALEGHEYKLLKDKQVWRTFDHQSIQSVFVVRCNSTAVVLKDKYHLDYFDIISRTPGHLAFRTRNEWNAARRAAGKPTHLEKLPGEL